MPERPVMITTGQPGGPAAPPPVDTVELRVPAEPGYLPMLRTVAAAAAASRHFTVDDIDDLRVAVDEACTLLLPHSNAGELTATFALTPDTCTVHVTATVRPAATLDQSGYGWMLISALTGTADCTHDGEVVGIRFSKSRGAR